MKTKNEIKEIAINAIKIELNSINRLINSVNDDFVLAVNFILNSPGRLIVTGIGKSAIIAQKIVATLNSTGTPSVYMHAADAIHGDLGIIQKDDIVMCLSKSGNTPEIKVLVPLLKMRGNKLISLCGNIDSYLALQSDCILDATVEKEACSNNLAPTSSTTAHLVMGDALAVALLECRGFTEKDFAQYHPGGALGKKLYLKVSDIVLNNEKPKVKATDSIRTVIIEISSKRLGATAVVDNDNKIIGIITDGDLRRMLEKNIDMTSSVAADIMSVSPKTVAPDMLAAEALRIMESKNITSLVVCENEQYIGFIHLHDILKEGIL
ncbi:MAG: KpsF/GutQ family sugar-phosphate isomerase [Bacteroidota bacterium]